MWHKDTLYIIAEIGVNHNGDMEIARQLIDAAKACGADAVKFQSFLAETLVTEDAPKAAYQDANDDRVATQFDMLKMLELPRGEHAGLKDYCARIGIDFLSTPFDEESADFLEALDVGAFKTSSGDLNNLGFMAHLARKGKPMIISTGMSRMDEVAKAVETIAAHGDPELAILHCVSNYPAALEDCNLRAMETIADAFGKTVGWSDHTTDNLSAVTAVQLGARIVEKHITLDKDMAGPDHKASMDIAEFKAYVAALREAAQQYEAGDVHISPEAEAALGDGVKVICPVERPIRAMAQKSLFAACSIKAGDVITAAHVKSLRPSDQGIGTIEYFDLIGSTAAQDIAAGAALSWDMMNAAPDRKIA